MDNVTWNGASGALSGLSIGSNHNVDVSQYGVVDIQVVGGAFNITGFAAGGLERPALFLINSSGQTLTLKHLNGGSSAQNQLVGIGAADVTVTNGQRALLFYSGVLSQWHVLSVG